MTYYCCDVMEGHLTDSCDDHGDQCPELQIRKLTDCKGKSLIVLMVPKGYGSGYYTFNFCPFCGEAL